MKRLIYPLLIVVIVFMSGCAKNQKETADTNTIDLEKAVNNLTTLKTSDFGKTIHYVQLETTDESLVGNNPQIIVLKDKIITITSEDCLSFDKNTGEFIAKIGHIGNDPEGYSNTFCWVDEENDLIYFPRQSNQLMCYDTQGNYKGKIELEGKKMPSYYAFNGETIIGAYNNEWDYGENAVVIFNQNGEKMDSIPTLLSPPTESMNDVMSISIIKDINKYGVMAKGGIIFIDYKDDKRLVTSPSNEIIWRVADKVYFKELFNDTVYTVAKNNLEPYITFNTGNLYWPESERTIITGNNRRMVISYVKETGDKIFFQCIKGLYADAVIYDGLFDKKTGIVKMAKHSDNIRDDINSFIPVEIQSINSNGEFAGFVEAADALEWLEDNPEATDNPELAFLNILTEDMNPVVIIFGN